MEKLDLYRPTDSSPSPLTSISISPKGNLIACGKMDSEILLIDPKSGKAKRGITGHDGAVTDVSFAGTSNAILSCSWDQTTRLWNVKNPEETLVLKHPSEVKALSVSLKLGKGASGSRDGMVKVFSLRSLKSIRNLQAHNSDISGVALIDEDQKLVTASYDGTCRLWDLSSYESEKTIVKQEDRIRSMTIVPDGSSVFLGLQSGEIVHVNITNTNDISKVSGHSDITSALSVDPTGQYLASTSWDRTIRIWSLENNKEVATGQLVTGISSIVWSLDGTIIYTADLSGSVVSWTPSL
ncbi:MAG: WD40 repeat domain-containing protein [Candidatus Sifarchaeia archaeon]